MNAKLTLTTFIAAIAIALLIAPVVVWLMTRPAGEAVELAGDGRARRMARPKKKRFEELEGE